MKRGSRTPPVDRVTASERTTIQSHWCRQSSALSGKMAGLTLSAQRSLALARTQSGPAEDFSDPDSLRVLRAAAYAVVGELGRQAAREYFAELIGKKARP